MRRAAERGVGLADGRDVDGATTHRAARDVALTPPGYELAGTRVNGVQVLVRVTPPVPPALAARAA